MANEKLPMKRDESGLVMIGEEVWDAESQQKIRITAESMARYIALRNQYVMSEALRCDVMFQVRSSGLYIHEGFHNFGEWCQSFARISPRTGHRLAQRGERMFLLINEATNRGLPGETIKRALNEGPNKTRQMLLSLSPEEAIEAIEKTWIKPDGSEVSTEEAAKELSRDLQEKMKGQARKLKDTEEELKTTQTELEEYRKIHAGETTVAQKLAEQNERLTLEIEKLRGKREKGEAALKQIEAARKAAQNALDVLRVYLPGKDEDFDHLEDELAQTAGVLGEIRERAARMQDNYLLLLHQRAGM